MLSVGTTANAPLSLSILVIAIFSFAILYIMTSQASVFKTVPVQVFLHVTNIRCVSLSVGECWNRAVSPAFGLFRVYIFRLCCRDTNFQ